MAYTKLIEGFNDLATVNPKLAKEWHTEKNGILTPQMVTAGSNKKVWWKCEKGHEWQAAVYDRNHGTRCPQCHSQRVRRLVQGKNDLLTVNPTAASEWHPTKNGELKPDGVTANSCEKVWWQCSKGHEWQAQVFNRNKGNGRCPVCAKEIANEQAEKLATAYPELAAQWHPTKNGDLTPEQVPANSKEYAWWQCEKGHEWQAMVYFRSQGTGCPVCGKRKVRAGQNDLVTQKPEVAAQWHPAKNGMLTPAQVSPSNTQKVWWLCEKGHEWQATIAHRCRGAGCPVCARGEKIKSSPNRLSLNPMLAKDWHPTKNEGLTPDMVLTSSKIKVWWQCDKGHEWQAYIFNRSKGTGCPVCNKKRAKSDDPDSTGETVSQNTEKDEA